MVLEKITPASIIRAGFEAKNITRGEQWMMALDARNKMSHTYTYNLKKFEETIHDIQTTYLSLLDELHISMIENALQYQLPSKA